MLEMGEGTVHGLYQKQHILDSIYEGGMNNSNTMSGSMFLLYQSQLTWAAKATMALNILSIIIHILERHPTTVTCLLL